MTLADSIHLMKYVGTRKIRRITVTSYGPIISLIPLRTVGSPPVSRILVTPDFTNKVASLSISSLVRSFPSGESSTPSLGMQ